MRRLRQRRLLLVVMMRMPRALHLMGRLLHSYLPLLWQCCCLQQYQRLLQRFLSLVPLPRPLCSWRHPMLAAYHPPAQHPQQSPPQPAARLLCLVI